MRQKSVSTLVFAASLALLATPLGVAAQAPAAEGAVTEVTGRSTGGPCPVAPTTEVVDGVRQHRGGYCNPSWTWDDPRLNGTATFASHEDEYVDGTGLLIGSWAVSIENDGGAWRMRPAVHVGGFPRTGTGLTLVFDGEGAYDGLVAVVQADNSGDPWELQGFILDRGTPSPPENGSAR